MRHRDTLWIRDTHLVKKLPWINYTKRLDKINSHNIWSIYSQKLVSLMSFISKVGNYDMCSQTEDGRGIRGSGLGYEHRHKVLDLRILGRDGDTHINNNN